MTEHEQQRLVFRRLQVLRYAQETTGNVALTCRYYGISRKTYYKWSKRYVKYGEVGLRNQSTRPNHCPHQTPKEIVERILYLRKHYHFGQLKIAWYLKRYHQISITGSSVYRVLKRYKLSVLPKNRRYAHRATRWKRYEKAQPGQRLQIDVKFLNRIPGTRKRYYQYTAIDDCTRIRVLKIYDRCNQATSIEFFDHTQQQLPFPIRCVQTDNGAEFQSHFNWHLRDKGITHVYIKPACPRLNGKVERSHRVDNEEFYQFLKDKPPENLLDYNSKLQEWENYYNYHRPHGALNGQTPYERLRRKMELTV